MLSCPIKDWNHRICVNGNITLCLPSTITMAVCGLARCASFRKFNSLICYAAQVVLVLQFGWMLCA